MQDNGGSAKINKKNYSLKLQGKTVCSIAFALLQGVSYNMLLKCAADFPGSSPKQVIFLLFLLNNIIRIETKHYLPRKNG